MVVAAGAVVAMAAIVRVVRRARRGGFFWEILEFLREGGGRGIGGLVDGDVGFLVGGGGGRGKGREGFLIGWGILRV